jgi:hypothetical protein
MLDKCGPDLPSFISTNRISLRRVEDALEAAGIRYDRLDGTMKRDERTKAMDALKHDPGCEVLLVSLKAGGVGLNLTAAQRVYLMDPYWFVIQQILSPPSCSYVLYRNPAVENQAVDRIVRCILQHVIELLTSAYSVASAGTDQTSHHCEVDYREFH